MSLTSYKPRYYSNVIITGYFKDSVKSGNNNYTFHKLEITFIKKDGTFSKPSKITISTGTEMLLMGIEQSLTPILGTLDKWESKLGKLNIPVKIMMLNTKLDPDGFSELALHPTKPTIVLANVEEPEWTPEEIEAIRPKGKVKSNTSPMSAEAPVVNTGTDF